MNNGRFGVDTEYRIHPAAALFPMLADDELDDLARDIAANGLIHPIVRDREGAILDGRNRLRACELAGVDPVFTDYEGDDPAAYVIAENVRRRHLTKGQAAMSIVLINETLESKDRFAARYIAELNGISETRLSQAKTVLIFAPDLVQGVMDGSLALDAAYKDAKDRKDRQELAPVLMERLRSEAPDLADLVVEEQLTLRQAIASLNERVRIERQLSEDTTQAFASAVVKLRAVLRDSPETITERWIDDINEQSRKGPTYADLWTGDGLRALARDLERVAADVDRRGGLR